MSIFQGEQLETLKKYIAESKDCVIIAHKSPDGDSVGSSLGLYHYLKEKGLNVRICHPDPAPLFLHWLTGAESILNAEEHKDEVKGFMEKADLIFCLDFNDTSRVGSLSKSLQNATAKKVMIDHHLHPKDEFDLQFSDTKACSTAQLITQMIIGLGDQALIDATIGTPLYCGIMTDTGSFRFSSVTPETHEIIAILMRAGVESYKVHESVFDTNTLSRLKLRGYATNDKLKLIQGGRTAIMSLTQSELEKFNYQKGDTEGLVNIGLSIAGVDRSIFFKESDGIIKISFRSKGIDNPVNQIASDYFGGGGHANAAGGKWEGSMDEAIAKFKQVIKD
jgi:phosphoesterase RecJ-like protein